MIENQPRKNKNMTARQTNSTTNDNNIVLTDLQVRSARLEEKFINLENKVETIDKKIDAGFESLKGYVPAEIYRLNMDAQKVVNDNHESRIRSLEKFNETNASGIKFSSDIVKNILKTIAIAAGALLVIAAGYTLIKSGGGL